MPIEILMSPADGSAVHLLTRQAVCARVSLSKTKIYDLIRDGRFPKAHEIEPGIRRWRSDEIDAWINKRAPVSWVKIDNAAAITDGRHRT